MSFTRRYGSMPSVDVLSEIEGVVIIDGVVAGAPRGASTGVAACVGEFADVTYGVAIDANGVVTTSPQPVEIDGGDFVDKVGGWDETIGDFGGACGNGYAECKSRTFSRLIVVPVNNASSQGTRLYRELPTCRSTTDPTPVAEVVGAVVPAGFEFRSGANRVRLAQRVNFLGAVEYASAIDGAVTTAGLAAATQTFNAASGAFTTIVRSDGKQGVKVGDILVMGVIGASGAFGANAGTYRIRSTTSATAIVVEKMDGATFDWTTGTTLPWRLYPGVAADTGLETHVGTQAGYKIPARPIDATIGVSSTLIPTIQADPVAPTADNWSPLSGLRMRTASVTGLVYTAAVQAVNAVNDTAIDALYTLAVASLLDDNDPTRDVTTVWAARKSSAIRDQLNALVGKRYGQGRGMQAHYSPLLSVMSKTAVLSNSYPGVGGLRRREMTENWPGVKFYLPEASGFSIKLADGTFTTTGQIDSSSDGWAVSIASSLPPEKNPAEESDAVQTILSPWLGLQTGAKTMGLDRGFYTRAKSLGLMAPRIQRSYQGRVINCFESGVTTSLAEGETEYRERHFSFYVQDSMAQILAPFSKQELTDQLEGDAVAAVSEFLFTLKDDGRIATDPIIDAISGNNARLRKAGVFVIRVEVEMNSDMRVAVIDSRIGIGTNAAVDTSVSFNQRAS